ncbi:AMP-binding protein [Streptomyces roseirectus]|uniref:AMP-binding protein n=1 Tax=Streptomyces roseirectus TaxID=2768066 RepID=A0A7H0I7T5_9ACTN|nr:AMP-binding protein [Streptomyces roseirectus]QNP68851.1 AMP-binding protein [Streptomyces roseirectus]
MRPKKSAEKFLEFSVPRLSDTVSMTDWIKYPRYDRGIRFCGEDGGWQRLTYAELATDSRGRAAALRAAGVGPDDVVPIVMPTGPDLVTAFYGTLLAGARPVVLPLPWALSGRTPYSAYLADLAAFCPPRFAVAWPEYADAVTEAAAACGWDITVLGPECDAQPDGAVEAHCNGLIQFTSGSRGLPRALLVSDQALRAQLLLLSSALPDTGWCGVSWLPLYHDMGLIGNLLLPVAKQWEHALMRPEQFVLNPGAWLTEYGRSPYPIMTMPNFGFERVHKHLDRMNLEGLDFSHVRTVITGAERVDSAVLARFTSLLEPYGFDRTTVAPAYGMAETVLAVTCGTPDATPARLIRIPEGARSIGRRMPNDGERRLSGTPVDEPWLWHTSCGPALRGVRIDIVDQEDRPLDDGSLGEIRVTSPALATDYLAGNVGGTARLAGDVLYTGDAGFLHEGELYVVGRLADTLRLDHGTVFMEDIELGLAGRLGIGPRRVLAAGGDEGEPALLVLTTFDPAPHLHQIQEAVGLFTGGEVALHVLWVGRGGIPMTTSGKPQRATAWNLYRKGELHHKAACSPGE